MTFATRFLAHRLTAIVCLAAFACVTAACAIDEGDDWEVSAAGTLIASDGFGRVAASGWGEAPVGGAYTPGGSPSGFAVDGVGRIALSARQQWRQAVLGDVLARDVDVRITVATDKVAVGGELQAVVLARHQGPTDNLRAVAAFRADRSVALRLVRTVAGVDRVLAQADVPSMTHDAGAAYVIRLQATGAAPTTIRAKLWRSTGVEPGAWALTATDSSPSIQLAGAIGVACYVGASATALPVRVSFDDLTGTIAGPDPTPTSSGPSFYISPGGSDARTAAQAQSASTPWRTPMRAYHDAAVTDGVTIWIMGGTWSGAAAGLSTKPNQDGVNVSKRVTFEVMPGATATFEVLHGTGVDRVNGGTSYLWLFVNPKQVSIRRGSGAALIFRDTAGSGWPADAKQENAGAEQTSALAFVLRGGTANPGPQTGNDCLVEGVTIEHWMGNGIMLKDVAGCAARDVDIRGTATGVRIEGTNGARVSTTLGAAAAKGAVTVELTTTARVGVGDMLRIGSGAKTQPRIVTAVAGQTVTLGGYAYPGGPLLPLPLEYGFSAGTPAVTQFGVSSSRIHDNVECSRGRSDPPDGDVCSEAIVFAKGARNVAAWDNEIYGNYSSRTGSRDYNIDGTGMDPFAMAAQSWNLFAWNDSHDNHAWIESGTNDTGLAAGHTNGGLIVYRNYIHGKIDFNDASPISPSASPTAAWMLLRATPDWVIRHNTFYITNGPAYGAGPSRGGLRFRSGGGYGGTREGMTILDNLLVTTVDSRAYDYTTIGSFPASHVNDYNLLWRPNGGADPAAVSPSNATYALSSAGLSRWRSETGFGGHDLWQVDPKFVSAGSGDFRLQAGSPAIGAASDGGAIGAAIFIP